MSLVRYEVNPISSLFDELDTLWSGGFGRGARSLVNHSYPSVDIVENEKGYEISAELPGLSREDIKLNVEKGVLTISGEKKHSAEKREKDRYYHFERSYGAFSRSFSLPDHVDPSKIEAKFNNGILDVHLTKSDEAKPKTIEIKVQ